MGVTKKNAHNLRAAGMATQINYAEKTSKCHSTFRLSLPVTGPNVTTVRLTTSRFTHSPIITSLKSNV